MSSSSCAVTPHNSAASSSTFLICRIKGLGTQWAANEMACGFANPSSSKKHNRGVLKNNVEVRVLPSFQLQVLQAGCANTMARPDRQDEPSRTRVGAVASPCVYNHVMAQAYQSASGAALFEDSDVVTGLHSLQRTPRPVA